MKPLLTTFDGSSTRSLRLSDSDGWRSIAGGSASNADVLDLYRMVAFLYRAVDMRARAVSSLPWTLHTLRSAADERGVEADLAQEPRYRGITRGMRMRLYQTEAALCLYGAAYWLKEKNRIGQNLSPRWLLPSSIQPQYDTLTGSLTHFERKMGTTTHTLLPDDLVTFWLPSMSAEMGAGVAPAQVAARSARVLSGLDEFAERFFERGAVRLTLLTVEGSPSRDELARLQGWWRRVASGVRGAWDAIAIRSTVKPTIIGDGLKDTASEELVAQRRTDICAALGVPETLLTAAAANFATAHVDRLNFYESTVSGQAYLIGEVINEQLLEPLGLRMEFHLDNLEVFQEAKLRRSRAVADLVGAPILSVNEARAMLERAPIPGGDWGERA